MESDRKDTAELAAAKVRAAIEERRGELLDEDALSFTVSQDGQPFATTLAGLAICEAVRAAAARIAQALAGSISPAAEPPPGWEIEAGPYELALENLRERLTSEQDFEGDEPPDDGEVYYRIGRKVTPGGMEAGDVD